MQGRGREKNLEATLFILRHKGCQTLLTQLVRDVVEPEVDLAVVASDPDLAMVPVRPVDDVLGADGDVLAQEGSERVTLHRLWKIIKIILFSEGFFFHLRHSKVLKFAAPLLPFKDGPETTYYCTYRVNGWARITRKKENADACRLRHPD